ncbi:MAG TPA: hypothetical protein PK438_00500, partial [Clostridia bacterium]|nr:hypothetical protein [Clostridia bacterium]
ATYAIRAKAVSGQPGGGAKFSLLSIDYNAATAKAGDAAGGTYNGDAHISAAGSVKIDVSGNVDVILEGKLEAIARIGAAQISIDGAEVGVNIVDADAAAKQRAYISGISNFIVGGSVNVDSKLNPYGALPGDCMAYAETGTSYGLRLSFLSGDANAVSAGTQTENLAYISSSNIAAEGNLGVIATSVATAKAEVLDDSLASISGIKLCVTRASSDIADTVKAYLAGGGTTISAANVLVQASGTARANTGVMPPQVSVSLANGTSVSGTAEIRNVYTEAYIASGVTVRAGECLTVDAAQSVRARVDCAYSASYSAIQLGGYALLAKVTQAEAKAYIDGSVEAEDSITLCASSDVEELNVSYEALAASLFSGSANSYAQAKVLSQKAYAQVGGNARLVAIEGDVSISAATSSNVNSAIYSTNYSGLTTGGQISAYSYVKRDTRVGIGDGALIESRYGSVFIEAKADYAMINARARDENGSLVSVGTGPKATSDIESTTYAIVGAATIKAIFGALNIIADSYSNVAATAYRNMKSFAGDNTSSAYITARETVKIVLGADADGAATADRAFILGKNTIIRAYITDQTLHAYAYSYTIAAGSKTEADSVLSVYNDVDARVGNAYAGGVDTLTIEAKQIKLNAHAESYSIINAGVTGKVFATSTINGYSYVDVAIGSKAELAGETVKIEAYAPTFETGTVFKEATAVANTVISWITRTIKKVSEWIEKKVSKIPLIGWLIKKIVHTIVEWITEVIKVITYSDSVSTTDGSLDSQSDLAAGVSVAEGAKVHLGGAAAGMWIDVREDGAVWTAGLDNDYNGDPDAFHALEHGQMKLGPIYNNDPGTLTITVRNGALHSASAFTTYWNTYLPSVVINNYSDFDLVFDELRVANPAAIAPEVHAASNSGYQPVQVYADEVPVIVITSAGGGDVVFTKTIENVRGSVTIRMTGSEPGDIYAIHDTTGSALRVNTLTISGARNIGKGPADKLILEFYNAFAKPAEYAPGTGRLVRVGEEARASRMDVEAGGAVYISIALVVDLGEIDLTGTTILAHVESLHLETPRLTVERIRGGGEVYIEQKQTRIRYTDVSRIAGADIASISFPNGSMAFVACYPEAGSGVLSDTLVQIPGTDYWYSPKTGMVSVNASDFEFYASTLGTAVVSDDYTTYQLPNNVTVTILNSTGRIVSVSHLAAGSGGADAVYQLSDFAASFDAAGNLVITLPATAEGATGTSVTIDKATGEMTMKIASNGDTIYIRRAADSLGWELPNGIIVYFKSAFVQNGKIVEATWIGKKGLNDLYVLEDLNDAARTCFHVVELNPGDAENAFVNAYLCTRTQIISLVSGGTVIYSDIIDEAVNLFNAAVSELDFNALGLAFAKIYKTDGDGKPTSEIDIDKTYNTLGTANANAIRSALATLLQGVASTLTENLTIDLTGFDLIIRVTDGGASFTVTRLSVGYSITDALLPAGTAPTTGSAQKNVSGSGTPFDYTGSFAGADAISREGDLSGRSAYGYVLDEGALKGQTVVRHDGTSSAPATYELRTPQKSTALTRMGSRENRNAGGALVSVTTIYSCTVGGIGTVYFALTVDASNKDLSALSAFTLASAGSGETVVETDGDGKYTIKTMNGGYVVVNGNYRFIDDAGDIMSASAILYLTQDAVAVYPDGRVGVVAVEGGTVEVDPVTGERIYTAAKIAIAPTLTQKKDADGKPVYSAISYYYSKSDASLRMTYAEYLAWAAADRDADAAYQAAVDARAAELEDAVALERENLEKLGLHMSDWEESLFRIRYVYTIALPALVYQVPDWFRNNDYSTEYDKVSGLPVYSVYKDYPNTELDYYQLSDMSYFGLLEARAAGYDADDHLTQAQYDALSSWLKHLFTPIYKSVYNYIDGTVIISPDGDDALGAYVTFVSGKDTASFALPKDELGRGIIDKYVRIAAVKDAASGQYTKFEIVYLGESGRERAKYDGEAFRLSEGKSAYDGADVWSAYAPALRGGENDLVVSYGRGMMVKFLEVMSGVYTTVDSVISDMSSGRWDYAAALYFTDGADNPTLLEKSDAYYEYDRIGDMFIRLSAKPESGVEGTDYFKAVMITDPNDGDAMMLAILVDVTLPARLRALSPARTFFVLADGDTLGSSDGYEDLVLMKSSSSALPQEIAMSGIIESMETSGKKVVIVVESAGETWIGSAPAGRRDIYADELHFYVNGSLSSIGTGTDHVSIGSFSADNEAILMYIYGYDPSGLTAPAYTGSAYIDAYDDLILYSGRLGAGSLIEYHLFGGSDIALLDTEISGSVRITDEGGGVSGVVIGTNGESGDLGGVKLAGGTLDVDVEGDIVIDKLELTDSARLLTRTAAGAIRHAGDDSYIYAETGSAVVLSAAKDIGEAARRLALDVPEALTVSIEHAANLYIAALELAGGVPFARTYPAPPAQDGGRDGNGNAASGDAAGGAGDETLGVVLGGQTPEELAQRLLAGCADDREKWILTLSETGLESYIAAVMAQTAPSPDLLTKEALAALLNRAVPPGGAQWTPATLAEKTEAEIAALLKGAFELKDAASAAYALADEDIRGALTLLVGSEAFERNGADGLGALIATLLTDEEIADLIDSAWDGAAYPASAPPDTPAREFSLHIGESTGACYISNEGGIAIVQERGVFTAGAIESRRGDVRISVVSGDIEAAAVSAEHPANIAARNIDLTAFGSIGAKSPLVVDQRDNRIVPVAGVTKPFAKTAPDTGYGGVSLVYAADLDCLGDPIDGTWSWRLEVRIEYRWIRRYFVANATRLDAGAGASIAVRELDGDLGLGVVTAGGSVALGADADILDARTASQKAAGQRNINSSGAMTIVSDNGALGASGSPVAVRADAGMAVTCAGGAYVDAGGSLGIDLTSGTGDVWLNAQADLNLISHGGAALSGGAFAGGSISIAAAGDIGSGDTPFDVDTDMLRSGGTLSLSGAGVFVRELTGDVALKRLAASGDAKLTVPGALTAAPGSDGTLEAALAAQLAVNGARTALDKAQADATVYDQYASGLEAAAAVKEKAKREAERLEADALAALLAAKAANTARPIAEIEADIQAKRDALAALDPADPDYAAHAQTLWNELNALYNELTTARELQRLQDIAQAAYDPLHAAAALARAEYAAANGEAMRARAEADRLTAIASDRLSEYDAAMRTRNGLLAAALTGAPVITTGGSLAIGAGGGVGAAGLMLRMDVGGALTIDGGAGGVYIGSGADVVIGGIAAGGPVGIT